MWGLSPKIKPGYKTENTSQDVCTEMAATNQKRRGDAHPWGTLCFLQMCLFVPKNWPKFAFQKQILGNVNTEVSTQCNITPNSQDAFMRRLLSPPQCAESCVCMLLCFVATHVIDLFAYCCSATYFPIRERGRSCIHICGRPVCAHHGGTWMSLYVFVFMFVLR